jgi:hypothetical protein
VKISVESKTQQDYYQLRDDLLKAGRRFDASCIATIPYHQLQLCCIGNAGAAMCSPAVVQEEKLLRRQRFLSMEPEEFAKCEPLLRATEMHDDVTAAINMLAAPHWADLTNRQQAWAKLHCAWSHLDNPYPRLYESYKLLARCSTTSLPQDVCEHYMGKLKGLMQEASRLTDDKIRNQIEEVRDNIKDFLPDAELSICYKEQIKDFSCTSDCFHVSI